LDWVLRFFIAASGCFAVAFGFKLISIKNLYRILNLFYIGSLLFPVNYFQNQPGIDRTH